MKQAFALLDFQTLSFSLYQTNRTNKDSYPDILLPFLENVPSTFSSDDESYRCAECGKSLSSHAGMNLK